MSAANVIVKFKQLFYNAGANSAVVNDAVDGIMDTDYVATVSGATNMANAAVTIIPSKDIQLISCKMVPRTAILNTAADDIVVSIKTNGVTVGTYNSNATASGAVAADAIHTISINTTNSFVDAGEKLSVVYTLADTQNAWVDSTFILRARPV
jgi:hypothetical protein